MNEDAAFIRALRERPDDETTRLVYADWLDDRSDPRAEYLRAEAAWVALQPSDEQYRPLYRRVSQLAGALDPEWFAGVSRMGHLARRTWEGVAPRWKPSQHDRTTEPIREWLTTKQGLENTFRVSVPALADQFSVPVEYLAFVLTAGGGWQHEDGWRELFSATKVDREVPAWMLEAYLLEEPKTKTPELWLEVAYCEAQQLFLCCDFACSRFGEVAEGENYHPWMDSGPVRLDTYSNTFLQFLARWSDE